jgi:hypothetical protein
MTGPTGQVNRTVKHPLQGFMQLYALWYGAIIVIWGPAVNTVTVLSPKLTRYCKRRTGKLKNMNRDA